MVLNKCDIAEHAPGVERDEYGKIASVRLSALTGAGVPEMRAARMIYDMLGFRSCAPYLPEPTPGADCLVLDLTATR